MLVIRGLPLQLNLSEGDKRKALFSRKKETGRCRALVFLNNYWKKRISTVLQIGNVSVISEAYRRLFNFGAETLQRDYDLERTFN